MRPRRTIRPGYRFGRLTVERLAGDDRYELRCSCGTTCERDYRTLAYAKHMPMCDACRGEKAQAATRKATRLGVGALTAADARVALADGPLTTAALEAATRSTIGGRIHRERLKREGVVCHTERNELVWSIVEVRTPAMVIAESGAPSLAPGHGEQRDCGRWEHCLDAFITLFPRHADREAHCPSGCGAFVSEAALRRSRINEAAGSRLAWEVSL